MAKCALTIGYETDNTKADDAAVTIARRWNRAANDKTLLAHLIAEEEIRTISGSLRNPQYQQMEIESGGHTPEELALYDAYNRLQEMLTKTTLRFINRQEREPAKKVKPSCRWTYKEEPTE